MDSEPCAFLTTREMASLLRVRERKIYAMAASGAIPCRRVTGKLLFPRMEVEAWLADGAERPPQPEAPVGAVVAGSHDPLLDWAIRASGAGLASLFDGSLDGLERVASPRAQAAGLHLFEPEHDDWNLSHVAAQAGAAPLVLVEWARRAQGLILAPSVAERVRGPADLPGLRVVRRQKGAGAGLLLAHLIAAAGVPEASIAYTETVARTEVEVAVEVAAGRADAAPGLASMARQFGLPFRPLVRERFDLLVDRRAWFEPPFQTLLAFARGPAFAAKAHELGGYELDGHGEVRWIGA